MYRSEALKTMVNKTLGQNKTLFPILLKFPEHSTRKWAKSIYPELKKMDRTE